MTPLTLPDPLRRVLPAARWEAVTEGCSGAGVWRSQKYVVKVQERGGPTVSTLLQERERLRWLWGRVPVPSVVGYEITPTHEYLAMTRLPGLPMSHPDAALHPERVTDLLARALRELHALPVRECPFNMSLPVTLRLARERVRAGAVDEADFDDERQGWSAAEVFNELVRTRPGTEDIVVTHGDACLPNVILNGEYVEGFVDVGRAGLADRHADLALAWRSLRHNLGPEHAERFLDLYGRAWVDERKLAYYRLLDELF
ncbi:aminoglycoside 3'-phosphotransferase [Deinococcus metallilatus]|uniref:Aminoglycoside 3'-phosphotransferase n=1 Tax=Deinococcus metallilatus TaxID=1211322 RepID=A0AAJ5F7Y7_9DEIO|nr:APH(3') family aminoglycoside O-phosphotransferase [Deinococcus metallilatus]MBB5294380.1 kanamycin kinase/aminoglycoside 3'-phosphotransferase-2 [Deinococcus metallilatus]QBY10135.1 aminoglycoside 3'-phosphotransferase [Deinococcus metallilatus]RXJ13861.1 aminoglycoside 3'-phosphotransferase [Deinococcus metallilatus]TLK29827.1 aminoglycoside 3'-phosphotransferase [Deinococcus metallilatus]GMA15596.1 aminoglycoside 3'-phosphotransferase [Deinococcus metallilatus]